MKPTTDLKLQTFVGDTLREATQESLPIIDGYFWQEDIIMILGSEKAGKSLLAMQMFINIASGSQFLGKHTSTQGPVVYIQAEGKRNDFVSRLNCMCRALEMDDSQFLHIYHKFIPLNVPLYLDAVMAQIDAQVKVWGRNPSAICLDSIYKLMHGDLTSNEDVNAFTNAIDQLVMKYKCGIAMIHHDSKEWRDEKQNTLERGDNGSYGSVFLRAYVDHILYLKMSKDKTRSFSCDTHRSGKTDSEKKTLVLVEPDPLCFQIKGAFESSFEVVLHQLKLHPGSTVTELSERTGLKDGTLYNTLSSLMKLAKVKSDSSRPKHYFLA